MDCSNVRNILQEHSEGIHPPQRQALIDEHLQSCDQCRLYAADLIKTIESLRGLNEVEPPAWLTDKVMRKIREEASSKIRWIDRLFFPLHVKLPIEAMAALLLTVAAIFIYKNMGPELKQMEVQSQAPVMKVMPADSEKEIQKQVTEQPQRQQEAVKQKDNSSAIETHEATAKEKDISVEHREQFVPAPAAPPAPDFSSAPSPAPPAVMRQFEAGKESGMAARDEAMQRTAPAESRAELAEKKAAGLTTLTLSVKSLDAAKKEIELNLSRNKGEMKILEQSELRIVMEVKLDPTKMLKFLAHLDSLGPIKEERQTLSLQSGLFRLIINKQ